MSTQRKILPNRRTGETIKLKINGVTVHATANFDPETRRPMEVFIVGPKAGSSMAFILHDAAVVISIALQNGVEPVALAKSIARVPAPTFYDGNNTLPASIIGAVLSWLVRLCDEWGNQNAESK